MKNDPLLFVEESENLGSDEESGKSWSELEEEARRGNARLFSFNSLIDPYDSIFQLMPKNQIMILTMVAEVRRKAAMLRRNHRSLPARNDQHVHHLHRTIKRRRDKQSIDFTIFMLLFFFFCVNFIVKKNVLFFSVVSEKEFVVRKFQQTINSLVTRH